MGVVFSGGDVGVGRFNGFVFRKRVFLCKRDI